MQFIEPRTKILQHIDRLAEIKAGKRPPPVSVEIDLSNRCNLGCKWCQFAHTHTKGPHGPGGKVGDLMVTTLALCLLDELKDYGVRSVTWSGGGEPTLHPDFDTIVEACEIDQGLYTNGTLMDDARARMLKRHMGWVYVSLDSDSRQYFAFAKGSDFYRQVLCGVERLVKAEGDATIGLGFLLNADNYSDAGEMYQLGMGLGVDYVQFRPATDGNPEWIRDGLPVWDRTGLRQREGVIFDSVRFVQYMKGVRQMGGVGDWCWWSGLSTVITPNGMVWDCCTRRGFDDSYLGSLKTDSFATIWEGGKMAFIREDCPSMCRGHIPNSAVEEILSPRPHGNFI